MSNASILKLREMFSKKWIYEDRFRKQLPRFFDQFDRHVEDYIESNGLPIESLLVAVTRIYNGESDVESRKYYFHFCEFLEDRILLSNAAPDYDRKPSSMVPGHGTYPGSFESGKKRN